MMRMVGVTQAKAWFRKKRVGSSLIVYWFLFTPLLEGGSKNVSAPHAPLAYYACEHVPHVTMIRSTIAFLAL